MILHIPHSSIHLPETFTVNEAVSLKQEFQRMTDWYTDELFDFDAAQKLVFPYSRLYCDVERYRDDNAEPMAQKGMGVCYEKTSFGTQLRVVSAKEKESIKSTLYDAHHHTFEEMVQKELAQKGSALIVDCHSFSDEVLPHEESSVRPDICIGTDSYHTPIALTELICGFFEDEGLVVSINEPFRGTIVPLKYLNTNENVKSVMIEINRKLYLDDDFSKSENFDRMKERIQAVLKVISE